ncbi:MAG TPA: polyribonucleotide nucleotidyltransferase [Acidimicrobiales bacterium]|nr:polyribonucleotide nucleotidyltransferase [Acidimicrobiales bacterium]
MAEVSNVSGQVSGTDKSLSFETGRLAQQSQGAVVATLGDTQVLVTANQGTPRDGIDFFPLTVDVEERMYAAGRIPGSFFRREGRPTDLAILTCRLIDRPLRPSFADGYRNETQVVSTIIGSDQENPYDVLSINGASAALMLSGMPFEGPIGAVRIAYSTEGEWIPHPTYEQGNASTFELVVAGREGADGEIAIMMVEAGGTESAWDYYQDGAPHVTEAVIADGLDAAKTWIGESIELQKALVAQAGAREAITFTVRSDYGDDVLARATDVGTDRMAKVAQIAVKAEREAAEREAIAEIVEELSGEFEGREKEIKPASRTVLKHVMRKRVVEEGIRMDGRGPADLRPVSAEVDIIPTAHGSALFQRGETQVLNVCTLGMPKMDQLLDNLGDKQKKRYMHHYNMPPHANGETGRVGSPKRREVGHGLLAERALLPVVPSFDEWSYTLRVVSEVLASNGSTSMASVCASSMSLMAAGVPVKAAVGGIVMGLIKEGDTFVTLTDILGAEDHMGDMDFKVAGTRDFVTALQLDTKIEGLPSDVLAGALEQAKVARLEILDVMDAAIPAARDDVGETAPKIISFEIPVDKIGEVIGPKGKVINGITSETGADVSVDDDGMVGMVTIGSTDKGAVEEARRQVELILHPPTADVGAEYDGKVVNITKFGAFVNILPGRDGLVHISKLGGKRRIDRVEDIVNLGDDIRVRVDDVDPNGKVSLIPLGEHGGGDDDDEGSSDSSGNGGGGRDRERAPRRERSERSERSEPSAPKADDSVSEDRDYVSFEDAFDSEAKQEFGDLGPEATTDGGGRGRSRRRR